MLSFSNMRNSSSRGSAGFTLIEVLVATTILLVIVILVSMVFQGSNAAFQTGNRKIKSKALARNIIGMISRDLTQAVETSDYPGLEEAADFGPVNGANFTTRSITFLALSGKPGNSTGSASASASSERALQLITYEFSTSGNRAKRSVKNVSYNSSNDKWVLAGSARSMYLNDDDDGLYGSGCGFRTVYYDNNGNRLSGASNRRLPDCVEIKVSISPEMSYSFVTARSAGKDKQFGTDDDIVVGANQGAGGE